MKKIIAIFTLLILVFTSMGVSAGNRNLQFYLAPQIMNDSTGEIIVDVKVKNFTSMDSEYFDEIKAVSFAFTYDKENFSPVTTDNGQMKFIADEGTLLNSIDDISSVIYPDKGQIEFTYLNKGEKEIVSDGVICRFILKARYATKLWNSFDKYPLRFVQGTIMAIAHNTESSSVKVIDNAEGIDTSVSGYNVAPSLVPSPIDTTVGFTVGLAEYEKNESVFETDAVPYVEDDVLMVPMRFLAEGIGMNVEWQGDAMLAAAFGEYRTLRVSLYNNAIYLNSAKYNSSKPPVEINGRIYIPIDVVSALYDNAKIEFDGNKAEVYIP